MAELVKATIRCDAGHTFEIAGSKIATETRGGCGGHDRGEYCYCPPRATYADVVCPECLETNRKGVKGGQTAYQELRFK